MKFPTRIFPGNMLDLAAHIVETKAGHFEPERFTDHYEDALKELIKKKQRGEKIERPKKHPQAQVINLMEALRQSAAPERGGARSHPRRTPPEPLPTGRARAPARRADHGSRICSTIFPSTCPSSRRSCALWALTSANASAIGTLSFAAWTAALSFWNSRTPAIAS